MAQRDGLRHTWDETDEPGHNLAITAITKGKVIRLEWLRCRSIKKVGGGCRIGSRAGHDA
jgi:hypothetical protein